MATMEEIARALGVSKSTVSKALSGAKDVSGTMRQTVLEKAVEMGYTRLPRNAAAPKMAVFITHMDYRQPEEFGYDIIVGFRKGAEPAGFQVQVIPLTAELQQEHNYDEYMILHGFSGGLFLGLSMADPWIAQFSVCKTPTVLYDNYISGNPNVTHVGIDNAEGMDLAVQYLKNLGHKRIGYLSIALQEYIYRTRYHAFFEALRKNGLPADEALSGSADLFPVCLQEHLPRLLKEGCTAIVCSHDLLAHSVMVHCAELGLRVPQDISILGFDDIPLCRYTTPPLSTVRQNRTGLGKSAFYSLSSQLNGVHLSSYQLHAELICRASCAKAKE